MNYEELLQAARGQMGPCHACPVCNGRACGGNIPGPGAKGSGTVAIDCRKENGDLVIVVSDDGVGMDVAAMEERLRGEYTQEHYGAWNVHKRLLLRYGEGYGLRYSLNPSGGVDVRVRLRA